MKPKRIHLKNSSFIFQSKIKEKESKSRQID